MAGAESLVGVTVTVARGVLEAVTVTVGPAGVLVVLEAVKVTPYKNNKNKTCQSAMFFFLRIKLRLNIKEKRDAQLQDKLIHQWRWRFPGQHLDIFVEGILRFLKRRLYLCRDIGCRPRYNHFCLLPLRKYCSMLVRVEEISIFVSTP